VNGKKTFAQGAGVAIGVLVVVAVARFVAESPTSVRGAVITSDAIPLRELPLADVEVTVADDPTVPGVRSDTSGFFTIAIPLRKRVRRGLPLSLAFRHSGYEPLELHSIALDKLCIARLTPLTSTAPNSPAVSIDHVVARYSINTTTMINVGSAVKTFDVVNTGNVPCPEGHACSPDGQWSATVGSASIDAGHGNEFRNARASCIAGPCPFTRIQDTNLNSARQTVRVSALNWSDTATFLLEAEVYRATQTNALRESYPVVFGQALTFTLPAAAEGVSIQAELDKAAIVFPLGPALLLSWADCQLLINKDQTKVYRCELKTGYRFASPVAP
jgi:hypothetical protein